VVARAGIFQIDDAAVVCPGWKISMGPNEMRATLTAHGIRPEREILTY
jgi:hypothetical protein